MSKIFRETLGKIRWNKKLGEDLDLALRLRTTKLTPRAFFAQCENVPSGLDKEFKALQESFSCH